MQKEKESPIPKATQKVSIFDTNAYREFTYGKSLSDARARILKLCQLEQNAATLTVANPFVIWELIGHLDDPCDPAYTHCLNALVALSDHTWRLDPSGGLRLVADAESTVCRELFHTLPPSAETNLQNLSLIAAHVKEYAPNLTLPAALANIKVFARKRSGSPASKRF
jgi:hypothetical protein